MEPQPYTPLMMAILNQMPSSAVQFVINSMRDGAQWIDRSDPNMKVTPLVAVMCARNDDDPEAIKISKLLLKNGANVNTPDSGPGATPLWMTAQRGLHCTETDEVLVEPRCSH
jgi:ankyrin repeat protein